MTQALLVQFKKFKSIKRLKAFTLIELIIVLAIISILFSVALPSYQNYMQRSQRTEGQALLLEIQTYLERYYFNNQIYPDSLSELRAYQVDEVESENLYYLVTLETDQSCPSASCYLLKAKPFNGQKKEILTLASSGEKKGPW